MTCLAGAAVILVGCVLPWYEARSDTRAFGGYVETVTTNAVSVPGARILFVAVFAAVVGVMALRTGRRLRRGWVVVAIGALYVGISAIVNAVTPNDKLIGVLNEFGFDDARARELIDQRVVSVAIQIGLWVVLAGATLTLVGAILAIRARRLDLADAAS